MKDFKMLFFILCTLILTACAEPQVTESPTEILKIYIDGYNRRDIPAMKKTFSKDTIKMYENVAQKNKASLDEIIEGQFQAAPANMQKLDIKLGDEKIDGDTATIEVENNTLDKSDKMPFVKENEQWKLALDKFITNTIRKNSN